MERKKKLRLIQISLLFFGVLIIFFTYINQEKSSKEEIISKHIVEVPAIIPAQFPYLNDLL